MARQVLETRVESLERRMTTLEQLPERLDRLESQILQFREEVGDEFSAVRREMRVLHEDVLGRIAVIGEGFAAQGDVIARMVTTLDESRTVLDTVLTRVMAIESRLPVKRRKKV